MGIKVTFDLKQFLQSKFGRDEWNRFLQRSAAGAGTGRIHGEHGRGGRETNIRRTCNCFVVLSDEGKYWTGEDWSDNREEAQRFTTPPDPFADAERVVEKLCSLGHSCSVAYTIRMSIRAAAKIPILEVPGPRSMQVFG